MKKLIYFIFVLLLISFASAVTTKTYTYDFNDATGQGLSQWVATAGDYVAPDYSNNDLRSSSGTKFAVVYQDLNLSMTASGGGLIFNISFDYAAGAGSYYGHIGFSNLNSSTGWGTGLAIMAYIHDSSNFVRFCRDGCNIVEGQANVAITPPDTINVVYFDNYTMAIYVNGVQATSYQYNSSSLTGMENFVTMSRLSSEHMDNYVIRNYIAEEAPSPTLSINTNLVNNTENYNSPNITISYNGTLTDTTSNYYNCTIYDNTTLLNYSQSVDMTANNNFVYTFGDIEKTFVFKINCSNFEARDDTISYLYFVDTINPIIATSFVNNTNYSLLDTINAYFNFTDANLYAYNITFKTPLGIVMENYFTQGLTGGFAYNLTSRTASSVGYNYNIIAQAWDSHTAAIINSYPIKEIDNGIEIADIKIYSSDVSSITPIKKTDRYIFDIDYIDEKTTSKLFYVESQYPLRIINSNYKGHIVDFINKKWIDFEDSNAKEVVLNQITPYKIEVIITTLPVKETIIKSIGDLNYEERIYYYNIGMPITDLTAIEASLARIEEEINMNSVTVILALIAIAFWLVYVGSTLNTKNEKGKAVYINTFIKAICYSLAAFQAFIVVQMSYSFAAYSGFNQSILDQLLNNYNLVMWIGILVFVLVFIGITGNALYDGYLWVTALFKGRRA